MSIRLFTLCITLCLTLTSTLVAHESSDKGAIGYREHLAAADARFAATWIAGSYQVPDRVVQELLYHGYSYAETLVAMAFMGEGLSLNEVLEQRRLKGGARWKEIATNLGLDSSKLPKPVVNLLWFGRNNKKPEVVHFLPDPHPGIAKELILPAFEPTIPSRSLVERFRLNKKAVRDIRRVLDDPLGVPEADLLLPAGRGLSTADWVLAGTVSYFKPFPMESLLAARVGEDIPWSEVALAFGFRPDVLTQGPLSGVYPVLSGAAQNTVLVARPRINHPETLSLELDLDRITRGERLALEPLLYHHYEATQDEKETLAKEDLDVAEKGLALILSRMSTLDLSIIMSDYKRLGKWNYIVEKYSIDLTGREEVQSVMDVRDGFRGTT